MDGPKYGPKYPRVAPALEIVVAFGFFAAVSLGLAAVGDQGQIPWVGMASIGLGSLFLLALAVIVRVMYRIEYRSEPDPRALASRRMIFEEKTRAVHSVGRK